LSSVDNCEDGTTLSPFLRRLLTQRNERNDRHLSCVCLISVGQRQQVSELSNYFPPFVKSFPPWPSIAYSGWSAGIWLLGVWQSLAVVVLVNVTEAVIILGIQPGAWGGEFPVGNSKLPPSRKSGSVRNLASWFSGELLKLLPSDVRF